MLKFTQREALWLTACGAAAVTIGILAAVLPQHPNDTKGQIGQKSELQTIQVGHTCASKAGDQSRVSCRSAGLGNMRFHCTPGQLGRCPETREVGVKNIGTAPLRLTAVSGSTAGEKFNYVHSLEPGDEATISPRPSDVYLLDVVMQPTGRGYAQLRIINLK